MKILSYHTVNNQDKIIYDVVNIFYVNNKLEVVYIDTDYKYKSEFINLIEINSFTIK